MTPAGNPLSCLMSFGTKAVPVTSFARLARLSRDGVASLLSILVQVAAYAGLDIAAKVLFGWLVMATYPIVTRQEEHEAKE